MAYLKVPFTSASLAGLGSGSLIFIDAVRETVAHYEAEVARLTSVSFQQSKNLAAALAEKNAALKENAERAKRLSWTHSEIMRLQGEIAKLVNIASTQQSEIDSLRKSQELPAPKFRVNQVVIWRVNGLPCKIRRVNQDNTYEIWDYDNGPVREVELRSVAISESM